VAVDSYRATNNRGIGMEIPAPETVADHHGGIRGGLISELPGREQASQFRVHSQHIEVVGSDRLAEDALCVIERPDKKWKQIPGYGDPHERFRVIAEIAVIRV